MHTQVILKLNVCLKGAGFSEHRSHSVTMLNHCSVNCKQRHDMYLVLPISQHTNAGIIIEHGHSQQFLLSLTELLVIS